MRVLAKMWDGCSRALQCAMHAVRSSGCIGSPGFLDAPVSFTKKAAQLRRRQQRRCLSHYQYGSARAIAGLFRRRQHKLPDRMTRHPALCPNCHRPDSLSLKRVENHC